MIRLNDMRTFNELCKAVADNCDHQYYYNIGTGYIGITFNTYEQMHRFMKSPEYKELLPYKVLSRYTKYLYFQNH